MSRIETKTEKKGKREMGGRGRKSERVGKLKEKRKRIARNEG